MTAEQLKALDKYLTVKMFEMIAGNNGRQPTPQASKVRAKAFAEALEKLGISEQQWESIN